MLDTYLIAMLDKLRDGEKFYLIYVCDETLCNNSGKVPKHINSGWFMFYVTVLNPIYWSAVQHWKLLWNNTV